GGRAHREHERAQRLVGRRLGLHAQLHERLADVGVVLEREAVLDVQQHRQVAKYCTLRPSCACVSTSTTRPSSAACSPAPVTPPSWYVSSACRRPTTRSAGPGSPARRCKRSFTASVP